MEPNGRSPVLGLALIAVACLVGLLWLWHPLLTSIVFGIAAVLIAIGWLQKR